MAVSRIAGRRNGMAEANGDRPLRVLGVGDGCSVIFLRWAWRVAELGHDVHIVSDRLSDARRRARRASPPTASRSSSWGRA